GGMREPAAVPLGLLVFFALQFLAVPALNAASRRMEAEADWSALQATQDPAADKALFQRLVATSLDDPSPPWWDYLLFADHPTIAQRVAMADAWQRRNRQAAQATSAQSP
ncbi:MAG: M48 family metalloprotease, partial [Gaiellaceae bacterium]